MLHAAVDMLLFSMLPTNLRIFSRVTENILNLREPQNICNDKNNSAFYILRIDGD
jgi:hypothetical protein